MHFKVSLTRESLRLFAECSQIIIQVSWRLLGFSVVCFSFRDLDIHYLKQFIIGIWRWFLFMQTHFYVWWLLLAWENWDGGKENFYTEKTVDPLGFSIYTKPRMLQSPWEVMKCMSSLLTTWHTIYHFFFFPLSFQLDIVLILPLVSGKAAHGFMNKLISQVTV